VWETEVHTGFLWGDLREINNLQDHYIDGIKILKWNFNKWDCGEVCSGLTWIRTGTGGGLF
jgi:hypothetical protein